MKSKHAFQRNYKLKLKEFEEEAAKGIKWKIVGSLICQRLPQISQLPLKWEAEYDKWHAQLLEDHFSPDPNYEPPELKAEYEKELERIADLQAKQKSKGQPVTRHVDLVEKIFGPKEKKIELSTDIFGEGEVKQEGFKFEEIQEKLLELRITKADRVNDMKSLNRKLDETLYLLIKRNRQDFPWQFPQIGHNEGETLVECVQRGLKSNCGSEVIASVLGHEPQGCYKYEFPEELKKHQQLFGSKVFYYKAIYSSGKILLNKEKGIVDYCWASKAELAKYFDAKSYDYIKQILFEDFYDYK